MATRKTYDEIRSEVMALPVPQQSNATRNYWLATPQRREPVKSALPIPSGAEFNKLGQDYSLPIPNKSETTQPAAAGLSSTESMLRGLLQGGQEKSTLGQRAAAAAVSGVNALAAAQPAQAVAPSITKSARWAGKENAQKRQGNGATMAANQAATRQPVAHEGPVPSGFASWEDYDQYVDANSTPFATRQAVEYQKLRPQEQQVQALATQLKDERTLAGYVQQADGVIKQGGGNMDERPLQKAVIALSKTRPDWGEAKTILGMLTPQDYAVYNYLLSLPDAGQDMAGAYVESLGVGQQARQMDLVRQQEILDDENASGWQKFGIRAGNVLDNIGSNITASPGYALDLLGSVGSAAMKGDIAQTPTDTYSAKLLGRSNEAADMALYGVDDPLTRFIGQTGLSIGNNIANYLLFGGLGAGATGTMMGVQAGANRAYELGQDGASVAQQLGGGLWSGVAEGLGEGFSFGRLQDIVDNPVSRRTAGEFAKKVLAQMGTEGIEESATEVLNILGDIAIMQDESQAAQYFDEYLKENPGETGHAVLATVAQLGRDVLVAGAGGALSGGVMGGGATAMNFAQGARNQANQTRQANDTQMRQQVLEATQDALQSPNEMRVAGDINQLTPSAQQAVDNALGGRVPTQREIQLVRPVLNALSAGQTPTIRQTLKQNMPQVMSMQPVAQLTGREFEKQEVGLPKLAGDYFAQLGNVVTRPGFGDVVIDSQGVRSSIAHGIGRTKAAAFAAVPQVIQNGQLVAHEGNWKGRGYEGYIFAAPVNIANVTGAMAVVVHKHPSRNEYYVHEIYGPNGENITIKEDATAIFKTGIGASTDTSDAVTSSVNQSIAQNGQNGNMGLPIPTKEDAAAIFKTGLGASTDTGYAATSSVSQSIAQNGRNDNIGLPIPTIEEQQAMGLPVPEAAPRLSSAEILAQTGLPMPNAKSTRLDAKSQNALLREMRTALGVPNAASRQILKPVVEQMSREVREYGRVRLETADNLFEAAWENGMVAKDNLYEEYKDVADSLRTQPMTLDSASRRSREYQQLRDENFGSLRLVNEGGVPVDVRYAELSEQHPELFPDTIAAPLDQLARMGEVAKGLRATAVSLDAYYGEFADEYKGYARAGFDEALARFEGDVETLARYDSDRQQRQKAKREMLAKVESQSAAMRGDVDAMLQAYQDAQPLQREIDKISRETALTEDDRKYIEDLLNGRRRVGDTIPQGLNAGGIRRMYEARNALREVMAPVHALRAEQRQGRVDAATELLEGSDLWKDKGSGLAYSTETMERNVRDIVKDKKQADVIINEFFTPVHDNEADATRFKNEIKDRVRELGLNKHESVYLQVYGELQGLEAAQELGIMRPKAELENLAKSAEDYLKQYGSKIDMDKVNRALPVFREIYDSVFEQMNRVYVQNGFAPVQYRQGYFPHFTQSKDTLVAKMGRALGIEAQRESLPTDIAGMTHTFRPGRRWNPNAQQRTGFDTEYNALKGMDNYLNVAADVIYHTEDIQKLRALEDAIREKHSDEATRQRIREIRNSEVMTESEKQTLLDTMRTSGTGQLAKFAQEVGEYTNHLAGKKSLHDRTAEKDFGRGVYQLMGDLESRVAANMVAINPGSWLTNFIPIQQAAAEVGTGSMLRAARDTVKNVLRNDGFVDSSTFLTNRAGSDPLSQTTVNKWSAVMSSPMQWIDNFTSNVVTRAKYYDNMKAGMDAGSAITNADAWAASVMADRSKGSTPTFFNRKNPITRTLSMFQLEVNNQLRHLFKDIPAGAGEEAGKALVLILAKYFIGAKLFNDLFEELVGRRPALDPLGIANEFIGDLTGYQIPNVIDGVQGLMAGEGTDIFNAEQKSATQALTGLGENLAEELPFVGGLLGGGRIPISSALPDIGNLGSNITGWMSGEISGERAGEQILKELAKPAYYLLPPFGGGQIKKAVEGAQVLAEGGSYTYDAEGNRKLRYALEDPSIGDALQAILFGPYATEAAREYVANGFKTESAKYTAAFDAARKAGIDGDTFKGWWNMQKGMEGDKDADGETIPGTKKANIFAATMQMDLTDEQKLHLLGNLGGEDESYADELAGVLQAGVSVDMALEWWTQKDFVSAVEDGSGKVTSTKRQELVKALDQYTALNSDQKLAMLEAASTKEEAEKLQTARDAGIRGQVLWDWWGKKDGLNGREAIIDAVNQYTSLDAGQKQVLMELAGSAGVDEKMNRARDAGVDEESLLNWWGAMATLKADVDDAGEAISGTKKQKVFDLLKSDYAHLSAAQQLELLYTVSGYKFEEQMKPAVNAAIPPEYIIYWWRMKDTVEAQKDFITGKVIKTKKAQLIEMANGLSLTDGQRRVLLKAAGVEV